jgi:hypothetical protein
LTHPNVSAEPAAELGKDRKNIWNSLPERIEDTTYRRYDVSKIAKAGSTSISPGVFPVLLEYAVLWVKSRSASALLKAVQQG